MDQKILRHHLMTGVYTYAGNYAAYFKSLSDDIPELCNLICSQIIHRNERQSRWVTFDADFFADNGLGFSQYDIPPDGRRQICMGRR
jgi:hypothetical protein